MNDDKATRVTRFHILNGGRQKLPNKRST